MKNGHLTGAQVREILDANFGWSAFAPETRNHMALAASKLLASYVKCISIPGGFEAGMTGSNWRVYDADGKFVRLPAAPAAPAARTIDTVPPHILDGYRISHLDDAPCLTTPPPVRRDMLFYDGDSSAWWTVESAPAAELLRALAVAKRIDQWLAGDID